VDDCRTLIEGVLSYVFMTTVAGSYNLAVSVNGIAVTVPTDFAATLVSPDVVYALTSQAYGAGLRKGTVGETAEFRIRPRDKYGRIPEPSPGTFYRHPLS